MSAALPSFVALCHHGKTVSLLVLAMAVCSGCYSPGRARIVSDVTPAEEPVRSTFGRVGLFLPEAPSGFVFRYPRNVSETIVHTAEKTWKGLDLDHGAEEVVTGLVVSGFVGLFSGFFFGVPQHDIEQAERELQKALRETPLQPSISSRVQSYLEAHGQPALQVIPPEIAAELNATALTNRDYRTLAGLGIDSLMEIVVEQHGFDAEGRGNPPMTVQASVQIYITRVSDGTVLFNSPLEYRGHKHRFLSWAEDDARKFRGELRRAGRVVAQSIVQQVFVPKSAGANLRR